MRSLSVAYGDELLVATAQSAERFRKLLDWQFVQVGLNHLFIMRLAMAALLRNLPLDQPNGERLVCALTTHSPNEEAAVRVDLVLTGSYPAHC